MIQVVFNIIKSVFSLIFSIFRPLKRLWCRRLKTSEMDPGVPTVVSGQSMAIDMPVGLDNPEDGEVEMESWDAWDNTKPPQAPVQYNQSNSAYYQNANNGGRMPQTANQHVRGRKPDTEAESEPEPDYFTDMVPEVKRTAKILLKKKDSGTVNTSAISTRLSVMGVAPPVGSELQSWEDQGENQWGAEATEDLSWEAEAALKEKRRSERETRTQEQQRKKVQRDAQRGLKKDSHLAVKLS